MPHPPSLPAVAAPGRLVVRLKGGDPLVFGRALPEIEALTAAGIAYEVLCCEHVL